jgi:two-component system, OmpR family, response regulator RpaA
VFSQSKPNYERNDMKTVFTTGQAAKLCNVSLRTVNKWVDSGRLRGYRIPGSLYRRIPRNNLIIFLKDHDMPLGELAEFDTAETQ